MTEKSDDAFRTISEVADHLEIPPHVLRFWETKFTALRPLKRSGGRRYYRPDDVALLELMLSKADVFLQNLAPGSVGRIGLTPERLRELNPRLITCSISASTASDFSPIELNTD